MSLAGLLAAVAEDPQLRSALASPLDTPQGRERDLVAPSALRPLLVAALATGTGEDVALSAPGSPETEVLVGDFTGRGFDVATLTNDSPRSISVTIDTLPGGGVTKSASTQLRLGANATDTLKDVLPSLSSLRGVVMIVTASRPSLLVALTLPTKPAGMTVVAPLDGR